VAITETDQRRLPPEAPPIIPSRKIPAPKTDVGPEGATADILVWRPTILRVLVVLPQPAFGVLCGESFMNFSPLIASSAEQNLTRVFNALSLTGVVASVDVACHRYSPVGGSLTADLSWLQADAGIAGLRNEHKADLVSLMVPSADYCGRGYMNFPLAAEDEAWAFTVVRFSCAFGNYSLAHEIGHNLGMRHDRVSDDALTSPDCNFGKVFNIDVGFMEMKARTVMAYGSACDECPRWGVYSTPLEIDLGVLHIGPLGVHCSAAATAGIHRRANNRQQLIHAAPTAAAFR
jgi:hypothetical protein